MYLFWYSTIRNDYPNESDKYQIISKTINPLSKKNSIKTIFEIRKTEKCQIFEIQLNLAKSDLETPLLSLVVKFSNKTQIMYIFWFSTIKNYNSMSQKRIINKIFESQKTDKC